MLRPTATGASRSKSPACRSLSRAVWTTPLLASQRPSTSSGLWGAEGRGGQVGVGRVPLGPRDEVPHVGERPPALLAEPFDDHLPRLSSTRRSLEEVHQLLL